MPPEQVAAGGIVSFIDGLNVIDLSHFCIVGSYARYDEAVRNVLQDARHKILAGFEPPGRKRENHLIWAAPGTGKTYFVQQVAGSLPAGVDYRELNLAKCSEPEFRAALERLDSAHAHLCLVDEIDAKLQEPWPYEVLLPYLDAAVERGVRIVFVLAGSSGANIDDIKQRMAARPKGTDLLSRIPAGYEYEIAPMSLGDRILVLLTQFRNAGVEAGKEIRAVEKLALYFVAHNPRLANARQLRELAVRAVERVPKNDDRLKYDHFFTPGDPENKAFWVQASSVAPHLANTFVIVRDDHRVAAPAPPAGDRRGATPVPAAGEQLAASRGRGGVPRQLTSFIGRAREIAEVKAALLGTPLLTLAGAGGCGKTRLALRIAEDQSDQDPNGVAVVELGALSDPALVASTVAAALELPERSGRPLIDILKEYLQPRALLLLLDNCEHVITGCAELAQALLANCPQLRILATSREPLNIPGERVWRVPPLSLPDSNRPPAPQALGRSEAVRLLVDRIAAYQPEFAISDANAPAVARLCRELDGIPLAIELAAARVKVLTISQIADRLGDRFRLLTGGGRTALRHHQTLRTTMDWSYGLLSDDERTTLRRLSVFAGGCRLEAAEAVCAGGRITALDVLDLLTQLVDKSLVVVSTSGEGARYGLLSTVRQYAQDKLEETDEVGEVRKRHFDWYLDLATHAEEELYGAGEQTWIDRLGEEHDNLRSALEWGAAETAPDGALLSLAATLGQFWNRRSYVTEGRLWLERALRRGGAADAVRAKATGYAGNFARTQGDYEHASEQLQNSLDLFVRLQDKWGIARATMNLGGLAEYRGAHAEAKRRFVESLALFREIADDWGIANTMNMLGETARAEGDYGAAEAHYSESLVSARKQGHSSSIAVALGNLGVVALRRGDHAQAKARLVEALILMRRLGDTRNIIAIAGALAGIAMVEGKPERAGRLLGAAESLREATGVLTTPADRAEHERNLASAHEALDPDTFASSWAAGKAMTLDEMVDYALAE